MESVNIAEERTPAGALMLQESSRKFPLHEYNQSLANCYRRSLQEIKDVISSKKLKPTWDKTAGVKWINWDGNQWVSYDDDDTFKQKRDFANSRCLAGIMVSLDLST
jgi:GH18 family chitinase